LSGLGRKRPITGTAFKIYMTLLNSGKPMGVREIQRAVGLKSASTVKYHLDRLKAEGLVSQLPDGRYEASKSSNPALAGYFFIMNTPIPILIPVSVAYAVFIIIYVVISGGADLVILLSSILYAIFVILMSVKMRSLLKYLQG